MNAFLILYMITIPSNTSQANNGNFSVIENIKKEINAVSQNTPPDNDYYQSDFERTGSYIYRNNVKSVLFNRKGWGFSPPIIDLNSSEKLVLRFDDLDADYKNYAYTIIHCDAHWQPSDLMEYEYIEGFYEDRISNYAFSRNTRKSFTHYWLEFPNANMQPKLSGNYLLKVFIDGSPDEVIFTRRFMVFEQKVNISATVNQATDLYFRDIKQEIDFTINTSGYAISNPYRDLRVLIRQNGRWDNAIYGLQPRLVQGNELIYDYEDGNLFHGGNEFRNFDTKSLRYRSLNVAEINSIPNAWEVILSPDKERRFMSYTSQNDINGKFLIKTEDYPDDMLESDYAWVHFTLAQNQPLTDGNVYVMGELTDWNFSQKNRMKYNYRDSQYELKLLLKQGFYDYQYVYLEDGKDVADVSRFEGSHSIAENDYTIYVYHRKPGNVHDSLVGVQYINSGID